MTEHERKTIYLCIVNSLPTECDGEDARPLMRMLDALTDEQLVVFHDQMRKAQKN
jgi:hypothetical protein